MLCTIYLSYQGRTDSSSLDQNSIEHDQLHPHQPVLVVIVYFSVQFIQAFYCLRFLWFSLPSSQVLGHVYIKQKLDLELS